MKFQPGGKKERNFGRSGGRGPGQGSRAGYPAGGVRTGGLREGCLAEGLRRRRGPVEDMKK